MSATVAEFVVGDVVQYVPDPSRHDPRWCREGTAIAIQQGDDVVLVDTYWHSLGQDAHRLNDVERQTATLRFRLGDYIEHKATASSDAWDHYRPDDRQVITSQHGLSVRRFVRIGAKPDHAVRIEVYKAKVRAAEDDLASAQRRLEWAQRDLASVEAGREW